MKKNSIILSMMFLCTFMLCINVFADNAFAIETIDSDCETTPADFTFSSCNSSTEGESRVKNTVCWREELCTGDRCENGKVTGGHETSQRYNTSERTTVYKCEKSGEDYFWLPADNDDLPGGLQTDCIELGMISIIYRKAYCEYQLLPCTNCDSTAWYNPNIIKVEETYRCGITNPEVIEDIEDDSLREMLQASVDSFNESMESAADDIAYDLIFENVAAQSVPSAGHCSVDSTQKSGGHDDYYDFDPPAGENPGGPLDSFGNAAPQ